jgi:hypothetical protein
VTKKSTLSAPKRSEIRKFGLIAFLFFGCLSAIGIWRVKVIIPYFFAALSVLGMGLIIIPSPLRPLYEAWLKVAHFLGRIITSLILAVTYYLVITPAALLKRFFSGRPLPLKPHKEASSYWVSRTEPAQPKERFLRRY